MTDLVCIDHHDSFARVTMTAAHRRNALSLAMIEALSAAFAEIASSDAAGIILAAEGPIFSAGHDFSDMAGKPEEDMRHLFSRCEELMLSIRELPQVVLAKVQGSAVAAGFQLMASCDLAVAVDEAGFWAPGGKGGWFCHTPMVAIGRHLTSKQAMEIGLTGDPISAATALDWGLINRAVPAADLESASQDLLARATRGSRASKALGKQTLYRQMDLPIRDAYRVATEVMVASSQTPDGKESITSFTEKRAPHYIHV